MPVFTDGLRVGESVGLKANPVDPDGVPGTVVAGTESWSVLGATGVIVLGTSTAGALYRIATALKPGTRTVQFSSLDHFGNQVNGFQAVKVIDAIGLRFTFSLLNNVTVESIVGSGTTAAQIRLRVFSSDTGGKTLRMSVLPVDGREIRTMPTYVLSTYKAHTTAGGGAFITIDGKNPGASSTSTDRNFDLAVTTGGADKTFLASAVTAAGATITGSVRISIAEPSSASLSTSQKAL